MMGFLRRCLLLIPVVLFGLTLVTFDASHIVPGDPVKLAAGPQARPEQIDKLAHEFGLDRPLPEQYLMYMGQLLQGNWGESISTHRDVGRDLVIHFAATFELTIVSTLFGLAVGFPLRIIAARSRERWRDEL